MSAILNRGTTTYSDVSVHGLSYRSSSGDVLISDAIIHVFQWILFTFLSQTVVIFGIITNTINIVCFIKQGFRDPVNVSLLGLAISDLGCLASLIWTNICFTPEFMALDLPFDSLQLQYIVGGIPHVTFTRVTAWITAFITLERCLCITAPLKVAHVLTPKRVAIVMSLLFAVLLSSVAPVFVVNKLGMKYFPDRNKTLLGLVFTEDRDYIEMITYTVNNVVVPFIAFIVIITCTVTLVIKLQRQMKWRQMSSSSVQAEIISNRNQKVAKMVIMISTLFIVCFVLVSLTFVVIVTEAEVSVDGKQKNLGIMLGGLGLLLESVNSSTNIFIYYHMSSKYRTTFRTIFCI